MICKCPIIITKPNIAQGGLYQKVSVPCGKCGQCLTQKRNEWTFRIKEEQKSQHSAHFLTLTYNDESIPKTYGGSETIIKKDLQLFIKRLRIYQTRHTRSKWKIRYYAVGEYGSLTQRPHYHLIIFNISPKTIQKLESIWGLGNIQICIANQKTIHYVTKYHINKYDLSAFPLDAEIPFTLTSRDPPIGGSYIDRAKSYHQKTQNNFVVQNGHKTRMPRIYKDKIFSPEEKHKFYRHAMLQQNKKIVDLYKEYDHYENPSQYFSDQKNIQSEQIINKSKNKSL